MISSHHKLDNSDMDEHKDVMPVVVKEMTDDELYEEQ